MSSAGLGWPLEQFIMRDTPVIIRPVFTHTAAGLEIDLSNGIRLLFRIDNGMALGLAEVELNGRQLRCPRECIQPQIATPDGLEITRCRFLDATMEGESLIIRTRPIWRPAHRMEWAEHGSHLRISTVGWTHGSESEADLIEWVLRAADAEVDGVAHVGFSYAFRYQCPGKRIYQIEDKASWELGGDAAGNTLFMRNSFSPGVVQLTQDTAYATAWHLPGIANPHVFQHIPLYGHLQGFTFQHDADQALITWHERPSHVRLLLQRAAGSPLLLHFNQFCFDLTDEVQTPARRVLVAPLANDRTTATNRWLAWFEHVRAQVGAHYGIAMTSARPGAQVESWAIMDIAKLPAVHAQMAEWNLKRCYLGPMWRSPTTEIEPQLTVNRERFGVFGNMCCPFELEIADCYGGWDGLHQALRTAVERGIETYMWWGHDVSSYSTLEKRFPGLYAREVNGQCARSNYGHVMWAINERCPGWQDYVIDAFRRAKDCGLSGIFRDSDFNMGLDLIDYRHNDAETHVTPDQVGVVRAGDTGDERITSQHDFLAGVVQRFQRELGMLYFIESTGIIGTPNCGTDYTGMRGNEAVFTDIETQLNIEQVRASGDDPLDAYFRGLAVRLCYKPLIELNRWGERGCIHPWWDAARMAPLAGAFLAVEHDLVSLRLLPDGAGTCWTGGTAEIIFSYCEQSFRVATTCRIEDVMSSTCTVAEPDQPFALRRHGIYRLHQLPSASALPMNHIPEVACPV